MPFKFCRFLLMGVCLAACSGSQAVPATAPPTELPFYTPTPMNTAVPAIAPRPIDDSNLITSEPETKIVSSITLPQSQPRPDFIARIGDGMAMAAFEASPHCVIVNLGPLFEIGDPSTGNHVYEITRLYMNGVLLNKNEIGSRFSFIAYTVYDDAGKPVGSHGGPVSFCIDVNDYPLGTHTVRIETETTQGRKFAYEWQIEISPWDGASGTPSPRLEVWPTQVPTETPSR
ncbi:MAG: hypothetical protein AAGK74_02135 [Chloroflexota bacterium]